MLRTRRTFTDDFKMKIVELYKYGKGKKDIVREYDLSLSTLNTWIRLYQKTSTNNQLGKNEVNELRNENQRLKLENFILKEATIILSRK